MVCKVRKLMKWLSKRMKGKRMILLTLILDLDLLSIGNQDIVNGKSTRRQWFWLVICNCQPEIESEKEKEITMYHTRHHYIVDNKPHEPNSTNVGRKSIHCIRVVDSPFRFARTPCVVTAKRGLWVDRIDERHRKHTQTVHMRVGASKWWCRHTMTWGVRRKLIRWLCQDSSPKSYVEA